MWYISSYILIGVALVLLLHLNNTKYYKRTGTPPEDTFGSPGVVVFLVILWPVLLWAFVDKWSNRKGV